MKRFDTPSWSSIAAVLLAALVLAPDAHAQFRAMGAPRPAPVFVENHGQWKAPARFLSRFPGLDVWIAGNEIVYDHYRTADGQRIGHVVRMAFEGAASSRATGLEPAEGLVSYIRGNGRQNPTGGMETWTRVVVHDLYPGIDLLAFQQDGRPRYDLSIAPGGDPSSIRFRLAGASQITVGRDGELRFTTSLGQIRQGALKAYQIIEGRERAIACDFALGADGRVGFRVGDYDRTAALVIDPVVFSTYVGGTGDDISNAIAKDSDGNVYVAGETSSTDFPASTGAYATTLRGITDAFVAKLSSDGSTLLYASYVGGSGLDVAKDIVVAADHSVFVAGYSESRDFPTREGGLDTSYNGDADVVLFRLDSAGRRLLYSTYLGGPAADRATALARDRFGAIYMGGMTASSSFPTTMGSYQTRIVGADGFVIKLDSTARRMVYGTFLGGGGDESVNDLSLHGDSAYAVGWTNSNPLVTSIFPTTLGAMQTQFGGVQDGFLVALNPAGTAALFATMLGGSESDEIRAVSVGDDGAAYVTGRTLSGDFPLSSGAIQLTRQGQDAFLTKVSAAGGMRYSTLFGGSFDESGEAVAVIGRARVVFGGTTTSTNLRITSGALQATSGGGTEIFLTQIVDSGGAIIFSTYLGGTGDDSLRAMIFAAPATLYLTGTTSSTNYPATGGAYDVLQNGALDGFITRYDFLQVVTPNGFEQLCAGLPQTISWTGGNVASYTVSISSNGGSSWSPIGVGVSGPSYVWQVPASQAPGTAYRIKVQVTVGQEADVSDTVFTMSAPPLVTRQPAGATRSESATAQFISAATGSAPLAQQGQDSADGGLTWTDVPGGTASTLTVPAVGRALDSALYRARFVNACDTVYSRPAQLIVQWVQVAGPVGGESFCRGSVAPITWTAAHVDRVNILISTDAGATWSTLVAGVEGSSYNWQIPAFADPGSNYRIQIAQADGTAISTAAGTFTIASTPQVVTDPTNVTAPAGGLASFNVAGIGYPAFAIRWQLYTAGAWTDVPGATGPALSVGPITATMNGARYRAILSNDCGSDTSEVGVLNVEGQVGVNADEASGIAAIVSVRPNPTRGDAVLELHLARTSTVSIALIDARGRTVRSIEHGKFSEGTRTLTIPTSGLPSGTYRCIVTAGGARLAREIVVLR